MSIKPKIILVCHASTGSGHKTAAEATAEALQKVASNYTQNDYKIMLVDILDFCLMSVDGNKAAQAYTGPLAPIHDVTWRYNFTGRIVWGGGRFFSSVVFPRFEKFMRKVSAQYEIAAVVCTHMMAANVVGGVREKFLRENAAFSKKKSASKSKDSKAKCRADISPFPLISVPTDYETEGLWPHNMTDLFCVATDYMAETLAERRVPDYKIIKTGMPTSPDFTKRYKRDATLKHFGLSTDKTLALIMAGASEPQPYVNIRKILDSALPYMAEIEWIDFVVCVGSDKVYKFELEKQIAALGAENIKVLGYTDRMAQLMSAADIAICKAGGMTVTECLCSRLPMILTGKAYAQESINVRFLTSIGAAYHCTTYKALISTLCNITSTPAIYEALKTNTDIVRRPDAAFDIARSTFIMAGESPTLFVAGKPRLLQVSVEAKMEFDNKYNGEKPRRRKIAPMRGYVGIRLGNTPPHKR